MIVVELLVRFAVNYPVGFSSRQFVYRRDGAKTQKIKIHDAYYEFWNVEGGNRKFKLNNIGLNGPDFDSSTYHRYIFLIGSSFIEAFQVSRTETATSVFDKELKQQYPDYSVLNLGGSGNDPYTLWFKTQFYSKFYEPDKIILAIEGTYDEWLKRHEYPLDFTLPERFGEEIGYSRLYRLAAQVRHHSSFINLIARSIMSLPKRIREVNNEIADGYSEVPCTPELSDALKESLLQFQRTYGKDFLLVSFNDCHEANELLDSFCRMNGINYEYNEEILKPESRFNGDGHLTREGNAKLGEFLNVAFQKTFLMTRDTDELPSVSTTNKAHVE